MAKSPEDAVVAVQQVALHRSAIQRYVLSIVRDSALAEDLTQETLLRAQRKLESLNDPKKLLSWLFRIATNVCNDEFRRASSRAPEKLFGSAQEAATDSCPIESVPDDGPRLDKALDQQEMSACVQEYVAELSDAYRAVIMLHDIEGLTNREIAAMLGISVPTAKIRLHRARQKLRAALDEACHFSTDERGVLVCEPQRPGCKKDS